MKRYLFNQEWFAIKYSLAAVHANAQAGYRYWASARDDPSGGLRDPLTKEGGEPGEDHRHAALAQTKDLVIACDRVLRRLGPRSWPMNQLLRLFPRHISARRRRVLVSYLDDAMLPSALVLLAGVCSKPSPDSPPVEYPTRRAIIDALNHDKVDPHGLIAFVERLPRRAPRVDYNIACLRGTEGNVGVARAALRRSLRATPFAHRPGLAARATRDPTLRPVVQEIADWGEAEALLAWASKRDTPLSPFDERRQGDRPFADQ